jgi:hypothetical protein
LELKCPFCSGDMVPIGEAELLRKTSTAARLFTHANWRQFLPARVWVCRECRFLALFASKEPQGKTDRELEESLWLEFC